ncbi:hypothetical protein OHB00_36385 [Streptomyces sp. NBC_00631]|uniref:hypothetical protein n=1 Tax=Streptomyces sp. NBC_00631 TaxID=2975793 RepID=UPI0030DE89B9
MAAAVVVVAAVADGALVPTAGDGMSSAARQAAAPAADAIRQTVEKAPASPRSG